MSQARKRAWRRVAAGLFLLPALAEGGTFLRAQVPQDMPANRSADPAKDDARLLVKQGRIYLQANDVARARQCAALAQQKNVKWEFYEDTPEKLLGDCAAMPASTTQPIQAVSPTVIPAAAPAGNYPTDAHQLMKMGRDALKAGNLDVAKECGNRANASSTHWGLFEDSPTKLLNDLAKARAEKDRVEAEKLLVEARRLLNHKEYDKAAEMA
ncbi:MAG: hypothetical protein ACJ8F7_03050, partial [Gemmataceae bacterium]